MLVISPAYTSKGFIVEIWAEWLMQSSCQLFKRHALLALSLHILHIHCCQANLIDPVSIALRAMIEIGQNQLQQHVRLHAMTL